MNDNNVLYDYQFGFRKHHSTSHAIITLVERVEKALDTGKVVVGVFLDLKKAFDTVNHTILLHKLEKYGIQGIVLKWFSSYLSCRRQYVQYDGCKSDVKQITHGVPQGSILGPLLFILYINDFSRASDLFFSKIFADDTSVFIEGTHLEQMIHIINEELQKIDTWLKANKLTINLKKTHYMIFHRARIKNKYENTVQIQGNIIDHVNATKFLGIIIDNKLNWSDHINYIQNKISKSLGIIYKIRSFLNRITLRNLYHTFVFPYLIYGVEVWGNTHAIHLNPIIKIQKKSIRAITFSHYLEPSQPLFNQLNILDLKKLVIQRISLMMFKQNNGIVPTPIAKLFELNNLHHNYNTRQNRKLHTQIGNRESVYKLFSFHGINIWNHLSSKISTDVSYACFKNLVKTYLQQNDILYRII